MKPIGIAAIIGPHCWVSDMHPFKRILAMTSSPAETTNHIGRRQHKSSRKGERGVTIFIVAVAMVSLLAMAVLAIDIVTLYVASGQAQQAADAAALAGAEAFSSSSFTSAPLLVPQSSVCNGSSGDADTRAQAIASKFKIGGTAPSSVVTSCNFTEVENPQITVTVARTGLPTFFPGSGAIQAAPSQLLPKLRLTTPASILAARHRQP